MTVLIGVDIGQKRDPTALCVAHDEPRLVDGRTERHFLVRYLNRLPLGTPYPAVADRVAYIADQARERTRDATIVYVDATGVGQPVVDLLRERVHRAQVVAVYFTHGDQRSEALERGYPRVTLGKAYLVSRLQALLQTGRLHLPRTRKAEVLSAELLNYELRVDEDANDRYGAFRVGTHDDLVTALGLAVQTDPIDPVAQFGGARQAARRRWERLKREAQRRPRLPR